MKTLKCPQYGIKGEKVTKHHSQIISFLYLFLLYLFLLYCILLYLCIYCICVYCICLYIYKHILYVYVSLAVFMCQIAKNSHK